MRTLARVNPVVNAGVAREIIKKLAARSAAEYNRKVRSTFENLGSGEIGDARLRRARFGNLPSDFAA